MTARRHAFDETFGERWGRRLLTGPALLALTPTYLAALPGIAAGAAVSDLIRGRPWTATRFSVALGANLMMHVAGFSGVFAAWLAGRLDPETERRLEHRLQVWWADTIWRSIERLYALEMTLEGEECLRADGPVLVLPRHASLIDTLLPQVVLGGRHEWRLRYVMKRELLWDPCLDAIGHRWPTAFVRRGAKSAQEIEHVARLGAALEARDAVVLFPEGTRFSPAKRQRVIDRLAETHPETAERAERLRSVLPPHPRGPLALLDADPRLDVVFCAHTGLEDANHLEDLLSGALLGSAIRLSFWRVPRAEIPGGPDKRIEWLHREWEKVDRWVGAHQIRHRDGDVVRLDLQ